MAEAVFLSLVEEAGLDDSIQADSAGIGSWYVGEKAHPGTRQVLARRGIAYDGRARVLTRADLDRFDYVLAMDYDNLAHLQSMDGGRARAKISLFLDYAPGAGAREVPDPYYDGRFEEVYTLVRQAAEGLLAQIREEHRL